jgi:hypothetical protein
MDDKTVVGSRRPQASLVVRQGARAGTVFPLTADSVVLGREEGVDISLRDPEVSRQHARVSWQAGTYVLEDLGSTNGTFLNGMQITGQRPLRPGDSIGLGQTILVLQPQAAAEPTAPMPTPRPAAAQPPAQPAYVPPPPPPPPAPPAAAEGGGGNRCLIWGCGCLAALLIVLVALAVAAALIIPDQIQPFLDKNGIPIQLTMLYMVQWAV